MRTDPRRLFGLTGSQLTAIVLIAVTLVAVWVGRRLDRVKVAPDAAEISEIRA